MALTINTNIDALTAYRNLSAAQASQSTSVERLSSGLRINKAADDAAGLAISQGLTAQINGLGQAISNSQDGINVVQTADGALTEVQSILQRVRTLTVQGANDSNDSNARSDILDEVSQLSTELSRIGNTTSFNGQTLLNGSANLTFQVGSDSGTANQINVNLTSTGTSALSGLVSSGLISGVVALSASVSGSGASTAWNAAISGIDSSLSQVSTLRANLGAIQNRLQHTINNLSVNQENLQSSNSSIQDADMASEITNYTRTQVLVSAGTSMLKQANSSSQNILSLLQ